MPAFNCPLSILMFVSHPAAFSGQVESEMCEFPPRGSGMVGAATNRKPSGYGIAFAPHFKDLSPTMRPATFSLPPHTSVARI